MTGYLDLTASDGHRLQAYQANPAGEIKGAVVVVQEIFGLNTHVRALVHDFAGLGYVAIAPALFDRIERGVELGYTEEGTMRGRELRTALAWDDVLKDLQACLDWVAEAGPAAVVGYCWGGSVAYLAACTLPIQAAVGYYGGQIAALLVERPDDRPKVPLMLHFGDFDPLIDVRQVEQIAEALPQAVIHRYPAGHGFNCDQRADFHAESAETARERTRAFLAKHLRG